MGHLVKVYDRMKSIELFEKECVPLINQFMNIGNNFELDTWFHFFDDFILTIFFRKEREIYFLQNGNNNLLINHYNLIV
jgi:hypothetical protein